MSTPVSGELGFYLSADECYTNGVHWHNYCVGSLFVAYAHISFLPILMQGRKYRYRNAGEGSRGPSLVGKRNFSTGP